MSDVPMVGHGRHVREQTWSPWCAECTAPPSQCGRCGWAHSHMVLCPPPRRLCGSCDAGLPMGCTCTEPPA